MRVRVRLEPIPSQEGSESNVTNFTKAAAKETNRGNVRWTHPRNDDKFKHLPLGVASGQGAEKTLSPMVFRAGNNTRLSHVTSAAAKALRTARNIELDHVVLNKKSATFLRTDL